MKILILFSLLFTLQVSASEVGNGGGISENNILQSWLDLTKYYDQMLKASSVGLHTEQKELLRTVRSRMGQERKAKLTFVKQDKYPFGGKMFATKPVVGADIVFNLDELFTLSSGREKKPLTLGESIALLTGILQRGDSILSQSEMSDLQKKIMTYFEMNSATLSLSQVKRDEIQVSVLSWNSSAEILMMDSEGVKNLTPALTNALLCNSNSRSIRKLYNVHLGFKHEVDRELKLQKITYNGWIEYQCGSETLSGEVLITAPYSLISAKRQPINENWWGNETIDAVMKVKDVQFSFRDIH